VSTGEAYYRFESLNGCLAITLLPELNDKQWADIERVGTEIVDRISAAGTPKVLVDLSPLSYMGSAMVALIVRLYKTVNSRGGKMVVVNQHELVFEVLKLAGLTKLWTIVGSREEAYSSLGVKATAPAARGASSGGGFQAGGVGIVAAGAIGTAGALAFLALQFSSNPIVSKNVAQLIEFAFAFVGFGAGMFLVSQAGNKRNLGFAFLAICVLAVFGGLVAGSQEKTATTGSKTSSAPADTKAPDAAPTAATPPVVAATSTATTPTAAPAAANTQPAGQTSTVPAAIKGRLSGPRVPKL
jgi:anti-anti-sigma factor